METIRRTVGFCWAAACLVAALLLTPTAQAADSGAARQAPPLEHYTCYQVHAASLTYTYMGNFALQPGHKYAWGFDRAKQTQHGHYAADAKGVRFLDGPLKGFKGKFETEKDGRHNIELKIQGKKEYASDAGIITWYCNCDEHDPYDKGRKKPK
ncbi:MAG: hypothetical protein M3Y28_04560 [Armatimonadota bacterium]|nr:hypothetical protein [Armatimonadota bacterium]